MVFQRKAVSFKKSNEKPLWEDAARTILREHVRRYPLMQLVDLYKLMYQASFGAEHAIDDAACVLKRLEDECAIMGSGPEEPLYDPIAPDGAVMRVHLRQFVGRRLSLERLAEAFLMTARNFHGSADRMNNWVACAMALAEEGTLPWNANILEAFLRTCQLEGWPARHHSTEYVQAYRPAYRVVGMKMMTIL